MAGQQIHNFTGYLLAFWRPQNPTYHALTWHQTQLRWMPYDNAVTFVGGISKHKTTTHGSGSVTINLMNGTSMQIKCDGSFLRTDQNTSIPIVKRVSGATIPNGWKNTEFGAALIQRPGVGDNVNYRLWTVVAPAPAPAPLVAPVNKIDPLPKRIAWLIADDACKNGDSCPITMDDISPLTAAVTTCFHCFDKNSIVAWLTTHDECPTCRKKCLATVAYDES